MTYVQYIIDFNFQVLWLEQQVVKSRVKRGGPVGDSKQLKFNDPLWMQTWYLVSSCA